MVLQNNNTDDLAVAANSFEFATGLENGAGYEVTVLTQPGGQTCQVGNGSGVISSGDVIDISVTCRNWGSAVLIENDDNSTAQHPQIAFDGNGNALAIWMQGDGTYLSAWVNRYTAGSGWGVPEVIENDHTEHVYQPGISFDSNGNALAVWRLSNSVWVNRYVAGAGWGSAQIINGGGGAVQGPQIAVDSNGNAVAVWAELDGSIFNIWANRYSVTSNLWGTAELLESETAQHAALPQVAFDRDGNAIAVWRQRDSNFRQNIMANYYTAASNSWGTAELIEANDQGSAGSPQIAFDDHGNAMAVWEHNYNGYVHVLANRYVAGSGWDNTAFEAIESDNSGNAAEPQIAVDGSGNAVVVWKQSDGTRTNIWANRYTGSTGLWGTAELIESDDTADAEEPQIALGNNGDAFAVWQQSDGTRINILANNYVADTGWGTAELLEVDDAGDAEFPQIATDGNGNALAVWKQFNGSSRDNIWGNRYE